MGRGRPIRPRQEPVVRTAKYVTGAASETLWSVGHG